MRCIHLALVLTGLLLASCGAEHTAPDAVPREITLTSGDSLKVITGADGSVEIVATILADKDDAGTYRTTSADLHEIGMAAKNALLETDSTVKITVSAGDTIVAISHTRSEG